MAFSCSSVTLSMTKPSPIHYFVPSSLHIPKYHNHNNNNNRNDLKRNLGCCKSRISWSSNSFDLRSYWTSLIREINKSLDESIPIRYPEEMYRALRYSVLSESAKRAPPVMCIAAATDLLGLPLSASLPTACALEMVHSASLIHDDLPCMDDSPRRRGRPSNHSVFGVDMAILAGDALFPLAFQHIVSHTPSDVVPGHRLLRVVSEIARSVGSTGMAAGQFIDLRAEADSDSVTGFVLEKKFGEMAECSAVCGGILGGADDEEVERLRRYGRAVGVLYELVDDIKEYEKKQCYEKEEEDLEEEEEKKKRSYVKVVGKERADKVVEELKERAKKELEGLEDKYGEKVVPLYSFVDYAVERGFEVISTGEENQTSVDNVDLNK